MWRSTIIANFHRPIFLLIGLIRSNSPDRLLEEAVEYRVSGDEPDQE